MVKIKKGTINKGNYGSKRKKSDIKYIVIHYTANDGDSDENNRNYFTNNVVKASAHYFVDSNSITCTVPDNYIAYHCGAVSYKHESCRNSNSIGIELCDDKRDGKIYPTAKTIENAIFLTKKLMKKYGVSQNRVIRHYDVTGKACPAYWCGNEAKDKLWQTEFWNKLGNTKTAAGTVTAQSGLVLRKTATTKGTKVLTIPKGKTVTVKKKSAGTADGYTWAKVDYNGKSGYVAQKYLKF